MTDKAQRVAGRCHCGAVRYEADVFLGGAYYCHCTTCRNSSGQPTEIAVPVKIGSLQWTKGAPDHFTSSDWAQRGFCKQCGSRLIFSPLDADDEWLVNLAIGSLDKPETVTPSMHIFENSRLPWYRIDDGLPRYRSDEIDELLPTWKAERLSSE